MKTYLCPYLNFNGNCREAMEFYHSVLGGELHMTTFGEAMGDQAGENKDKIMHAQLKHDDFTFMASEGNPESQVKFGDNISMSIVGDDDEKLSGYFEKLAEGGAILMPLAKQSWGDKFGLLKDKFGVQWMVNISPKKDK